MRQPAFILAGAAATAISLAGCSGQETLDGPQAVAEKLGCASTYKNVHTDELGVDAAGKCHFHGQTVRLLTFASNEARDTFSEIAGSFGGRYVEGDGYLIEVHGSDVQKAAEERLG